MPADRARVDAAARAGYLNETPRERQVREYQERRARDFNRVAIDSARERRRKARCALTGHEPTEEVDSSGVPYMVCRRCAETLETEDYA